MGTTTDADDGAAGTSEQNPIEAACRRAFTFEDEVVLCVTALEAARTDPLAIAEACSTFESETDRLVCIEAVSPVTWDPVPLVDDCIEYYGWRSCITQCVSPSWDASDVPRTCTDLATEGQLDEVEQQVCLEWGCAKPYDPVPFLLECKPVVDAGGVERSQCSLAMQFASWDPIGLATACDELFQTPEDLGFCLTYAARAATRIVEEMAACADHHDVRRCVQDLADDAG